MATPEVPPAAYPTETVQTEKKQDRAISRRTFLGGTTVAATAGAVLLPAMLGAPGATAKAQFVGPLNDNQRRYKAFFVRAQTAFINRLKPVAPHPCNGDEALYPKKIATFTKGLPHDSLGEVNLAAYGTLVSALSSGHPGAFENITMGCPVPAQQRKLVNPQSGLAFDLEGPDSHRLAIPPAPTFASAEQAGEIVENYWMAHLRDVAFWDYATDPLAAQARADISSLSDFRGPKVAGQVTAQTLFRDALPGSLVGPYLSQFLWKPCPFGANFIEQRMRTTVPFLDHMTNAADWVAIQSGCQPTTTDVFDGQRRYIRNGRDLGQWVHVDVLFQAYFHACLILLTPPDPSDPDTGGGIGAPLNPSNPYLASQTQDGFGTFGGPFIKTLVAEVATRALKAIWFQKWFVHRRLRPEVFGGRVHHRIVSGRNYPIHGDALNSQAATYTFSQNGTYFLPMAFPEGSPLHPSYGAGHATVAGACVTILKALFDGSAVIPNPVEATPDGLSLVPYVGPPLTVEGELNKLASNVATGRNIAGVHWRTDGIESLRLGETVAMGLLSDMKATFNENFTGFSFKKFDGTTATV